MTGSWADKAIKEAKLVRTKLRSWLHPRADKFNRIPDLSGIEIPSNAAYLHVTSNETIEGTQYAMLSRNW